jgi:serine/threonine protein kinase HipA of HipAB toxin-antitoxin module
VTDKAVAPRLRARQDIDVKRHLLLRAKMRNIAQVVATEGTHADIAELIRRRVFNALIGNGDMHLKNCSLTYPDRRTAALAPAYDFVSTVPYIPNETIALKVSRKRPIWLAVTHKFLLVVLPRYERLRQGQRGGRGRAI